jgi:hypothetical protein
VDCNRFPLRKAEAEYEVGSVVSYMDYRTRATRGRGSRIDPVVFQILEALHFAGGATHRQAVADYIAHVRAGRPAAAGRELQDEVYRALAAHLAASARRKAEPLVCLPLGEQSYRWALTERGRAVFAASAESFQVAN